VALPVAGHLQRVDRIRLVAGCDERLHPWTAVGFDADHDLRRLVIAAQMLPDHRVQPGDSRDSLRKLCPAQHPSGLVLQLHIVVLLGSVVPDEQHPLSSSTTDKRARCLRENCQQPNDQVFTLSAADTTSHQRSRLPTTSRGTICA
jgi:hypothetical protein